MAAIWRPKFLPKAPVAPAIKARAAVEHDAVTARAHVRRAVEVDVLQTFGEGVGSAPEAIGSALGLIRRALLRRRCGLAGAKQEPERRERENASPSHLSNPNNLRVTAVKISQEIVDFAASAFLPDRTGTMSHGLTRPKAREPIIQVGPPALFRPGGITLSIRNLFKIDKLEQSPIEKACEFFAELALTAFDNRQVGLSLFASTWRGGRARRTNA
jgi:hypothetical protein